MRHALLPLFALLIAMPASAAGTASGIVAVQGSGTIRITQSIAYPSRSARNARIEQTEVLLTDVAIDASALANALDAHIVAINDPALRERNYIVLAVDADGGIAMNATFSKGMVQYINDTGHGLKIAWATRSATRLDGRLFSEAPLRTMDGTTYTVDVRFAVDVVAPPAGQTLAAGGGDPGQAFVAFMTTAQRKNWAATKAALSANAVKLFDKDYNSPAENASDAVDLLQAWIPKDRMKVTAGRMNGDSAILDVEGEMFPGMSGLSLVRMVKEGGVWKFDQAARAGLLP